MASAEPIMGVCGLCTSGVQGQSPWAGVKGQSPLKLNAFWCCHMSEMALSCYVYELFYGLMIGGGAWPHAPPLGSATVQFTCITKITLMCTEDWKTYAIHSRNCSEILMILTYWGTVLFSFSAPLHFSFSRLPSPPFRPFSTLPL